MTTTEERRQAAAEDVAVTIVDTDVHPMPVSADVLKSYAPAEWKDTLWPTGNAVAPVGYFYDTPPTRTRRIRFGWTPNRPAGDCPAAIRTSRPNNC